MLWARVAEARRSIGAWLAFYNDERKHQSLGYRTPAEVFTSAQACGHVDNATALTTCPQEEQKKQQEKDSHYEENMVNYQQARKAA